MYHQHFDQIPSTQTYLRDHISEFHDEHILISCSEQTNGIGRSGNAWDYYPQSLAMSFTITPNKFSSATPLELGLLSTFFLEKKFGLETSLKWPNDIMTKDKSKCGGIICHYLNSLLIIAGIGINFSVPTKTYSYQTSGLLLNEKINLKEISLELYQYILNNRLGDSLPKLFEEQCSHLNQSVTIIDDTSSISGVFKGVDENGSALIQTKDKIEKIISGSLLLN